MPMTLSGTTGIALPTAAAPTFSAYVASNQAVSSSTYVKVPCNTEEWDTNSNYDNATNYRFTPTVAGYYQLDGRVSTSGGSTRAFCTIYKNGAEFKRGNDCSAAVNGVVVSTLVYANVSTDYFELYMYTNIGGTNLTGGADQTYFQGSFVRSA